MTRMKLILFIAAMCCLLSLLVYSQEPARPGVQEPGSKLQLFEAEIDWRMQELELKMSELEVIVAKVELEKSELRLKAAQDQGEALKLHQWGLVGIQERVDLIGGNLMISSDENKGTLIQVIAPLPKMNNSAYG